MRFGYGIVQTVCENTPHHPVPIPHPGKRDEKRRRVYLGYSLVQSKETNGS